MLFCSVYNITIDKQIEMQKMKKFNVGESLKINGKKFTVTKASDLDVLPGTQELRGTFEGDPSFLVGKRTIFTAYLCVSKTTYLYDHSAN